MSVETAPSVKSGVSPEEYLAQEQLAETRSEYVNGEIIPMTGASERHCLIAGNLQYRLRVALGDDDYRFYSGDLKTKTNQDSYRYPDVIVLKPPVEFDQGRKHVITNPLVIFEILSPSTEANDRGEKFADYRSIDSLQAYVLVAQHRQTVECFTRQSDNSWVLTESSADEITILPLNCSLKLPEIYRNVEFDNQPDSQQESKSKETDLPKAQ